MSHVAFVRTTPETVIADYARLLDLAGVSEALPPGEPLLIKLNLSWSRYYPAANTPPWQLDGILQALFARGHRPEHIVCAESRTSYVNPRRALQTNRLAQLLERHGVRFVSLARPERVLVKPSEPLLVLHRLYPDGIPVPATVPGKNILHLATMKTHGLATITGAVKNAWGSILPPQTHYLHRFIHEVLADLLAVQRAVNPRVFAVLDGTVCGDGAGPRTMQPRIGNCLVAGSDPLAVDAVAARIMGFDPLSIPYIALAHAMGLGDGDPDEVAIEGDDPTGLNLGFHSQTNFALRGDQLLLRGPGHALERWLLRTRLRSLIPLASAAYHDALWYNTVGRARLAAFLRTGWGKLLLSY